MGEYLIVGAGFSGAVIARLIAENFNCKVFVIDRRNHIAGNCYDYRDTNGIMLHKYGPHIFHTNDLKVWNFVNRFSCFNNYEHEVLANVDGKNINIPFNINTLYAVYPEKVAKRLEDKLLSRYKYGTKIPILDFKSEDDIELKNLADFIYEKIFLHYTEKQWGMPPEQLDSSVTARVPVFLSHDNRYFQDTYQGIPVSGYTELIRSILNHENIILQLNTEYIDVNTEKYEKIFYTGAIDEFYDYKYGKLPYRSVYFVSEEYPQEFYQPKASINYPCSEDFTRVHEYKHFLNDKSNNTVVTREYSELFINGHNERFYPIPKSENYSLYEKYFNEAKKEKNIYFLGRLGDYKYYNMDQAILRAINLYEEIF